MSSIKVAIIERGRHTSFARYVSVRSSEEDDNVPQCQSCDSFDEPATKLFSPFTFTASLAHANFFQERINCLEVIRGNCHQLKNWSISWLVLCDFTLFLTHQTLLSRWQECWKCFSKSQTQVDTHQYSCKETVEASYRSTIYVNDKSSITIVAWLSVPLSLTLASSTFPRSFVPVVFVNVRL